MGKQDNLKIMSLDIATSTGYSIFQNKKLLSYGLIKLNTDKCYILRLKEFRKKIQQLLKKHAPEIVIIELVYSGPNAHTTAYLNGLRAIVLEVIPRKVKVFSMSVIKARKVVLERSKTTKQDVFDWAKDKFNLSTFVFSKDNDITDSILLSWSYYCLDSLEEVC